MLYSECHQGQHHHCLHSLKFTYCVFLPNLWLIVKSFVSFDSTNRVVKESPLSHPHLHWVGHLADYQPLLVTRIPTGMLCVINPYQGWRGINDGNIYATDGTFRTSHYEEWHSLSDTDKKVKDECDQNKKMKENNKMKNKFNHDKKCQLSEFSSLSEDIRLMRQSSCQRRQLHLNR